MKYRYGYFDKEGTEFVITNPATPRAFDNFLWNDAAFSNIQQTGVGYFDYQIGDNEAVQLFTGVGRICDFDVFGRDHLMSRLVYIRDNDTGEFWNLNWEPVRKKYEDYRCVHGLGYTIISTTVNGITAEMRIFIPSGKDPVELWTLKVSDSSGKTRNISLFVYNQFQFKFKWGFDSYGDMIYRSSRFNRELNAVVARKYPYTRPHDYLTGFMTSDKVIAAFDGTRDAFTGIYNTLAEPEAVVRGRCSNTPGSADATIGVMQFDLILKDSKVEEISIIVGATDSESKIGDFRAKYLGSFDKYFNELKEEKQALVQRNHIKTPDCHFDIMLNGWVKQGALYGATWCRWGWMGFRDIVQHGLGVSVIKPERTKEIIREAMKHQYQSGLALRGWNPVDEKPYSDSALWMVFTLVSYLKETGDMDFLEEVVPYYDKGSDTVLGHILKVVEFFEANKGAHGLILIKFGDWNDSLTAVGKEGRGESVWLTMAYAEALQQLAGLAEHMKDEKLKESCVTRRDAVIRAINENAWDGKWYIRCFDDNGIPIGSHICDEGKIFMETQGWALITGAADKERAEALINSCDELLGTEMGYLLLAPCFTKIDNNIGRISSMQPGICENGTVYSHLNIWMIQGLLRNRLADKAYEVFKRITPGYVSGDEDLKQKCLPYMYANCYYGPQHANNRFQMEFSWITGSLAWYNNVLLKDMLGAKAEYNGLLIDPCIPSEWDECEVKRHYRGAVYHITIKNPEHISYGKVKITLDGEAYEGNLLPVFSDGKTHRVDVVLTKE